jgi:hypothetical protein
MVCGVWTRSASMRPVHQLVSVVDSWRNCSRPTRANASTGGRTAPCPGKSSLRPVRGQRNHRPPLQRVWRLDPLRTMGRRCSPSSGAARRPEGSVLSKRFFPVMPLDTGPGMAMAQDPESTEYDGMPRSAIATGMVDYDAFGNPGAAAPVPRVEDVMKKLFIRLRSRTGHDFSLIQAKHNPAPRQETHVCSPDRLAGGICRASARDAR